MGSQSQTQLNTHTTVTLLVPHPAEPYVCRAPLLPVSPYSLTTGKSTEHQLEGHEHKAQVVGLWYDLHAAVLGVVKDPSTLQVGVAQLRVAHIADVQKPIPHVPQGPGWKWLRGWYPGVLQHLLRGLGGNTRAAPRAGKARGQGPGLRFIQWGLVSTLAGPKKSRMGVRVRRLGKSWPPKTDMLPC